MTKSNPIRDKKYLDGERLFTVYWQEMGDSRSTIRLQKWCLAHSIVNPKTQNVPTRMGLWKAMWRWAVENQDKSYEIWHDAIENNVASMNSKEAWQESWDKLVLNNAKTSFQNVTHTRKFYHDS